MSEIEKLENAIGRHNSHFVFEGGNGKNYTFFHYRGRDINELGDFAGIYCHLKFEEGMLLRDEVLNFNETNSFAATRLSEDILAYVRVGDFKLYIAIQENGKSKEKRIDTVKTLKENNFTIL